MLDTPAKFSVLAEQLRERIRLGGPITFRDFMEAALYDPRGGYYFRDDLTKWGREGDYRTSPERSTLFAATFARYFAKLYEQLGRPSRWTIFEAGAGDGTLACGILRTLQSSYPHVFAATSYVIDEISSSSRDLAKKRLQQFGERVAFKKLDEVEIDPGVVFSNELLDAFPVHRVTMRGGTLKELFLDVSEDGTFEWLPAAPSTPRLIEHFAELEIHPPDAQVVEVNLEIDGWLQRVSARLKSGFVVTVDYGATSEELYSAPAHKQGTLRAFRRHQFVEDVLAEPGEHDLTATVNWSLVKSAGAPLGLEVVDFERQDKFLLAAGFLEQLEIESRQCVSDADRLRLSTTAREMILPDGMAAHFQVMVQKKVEPRL